MQSPFFNYYIEEKKRYLENCTQCGLCARGCPILPYTEGAETSPREIQKAVFDFLNGGPPKRLAETKAFACMGCFKCTAGMCPEELHPMLINQFIKRETIARGLEKKAYGDASRPGSAHRVLASMQTSGAEYERITTPGKTRRARFVFFPGCNVYLQPEKILNALDIMKAIGDDHAFLPGLDHCCGESMLFQGDLEEGAEKAGELTAAIARFEPEAVVLWCPTCQCGFEKNIIPAMDVPFDILSFPQYLAANMHKLPLTDAAAGTVTLHEACKSAYTGVDLDGPRQVLRRLPGVTLREMEHHGPETVCCGSGAICWRPESSHRIREDRLQEASRTGAERLVTVCHYCNQTFASEEANHDFRVTNYVNLVAEAIGIRREDSYKKYARWRNPVRILEDAEANISESPFEKKDFVEAVKSVFME